MAGPYKGAPYSLVIRVPVQAGPFDLSVVTVRAAINLDPTTAQVTVTSDPLPQIIQGIPLPYRDVRVTVDRPGVMRSATTCDPMQFGAQSGQANSQNDSMSTQCAKAKAEHARRHTKRRHGRRR